jgi:hypothetical protein
MALQERIHLHQRDVSQTRQLGSSQATQLQANQVQATQLQALPEASSFVRVHVSLWWH